LHHILKASGLRSSPSPVNCLGDGSFILIPGKGSGTGSDSQPLSPPRWSDMLSESVLVLLVLPGSPAGTATGTLLDDSFCGDSVNLPGGTVDDFVVLLLISLDHLVHYLCLVA